MLHDRKFSKNLHLNADSWRVFGDDCRKLLERLAFEEPDLMKVNFLIFLRLVFSYVLQRDELLQARAAFCAHQENSMLLGFLEVLENAILTRASFTFL